VGLPFRDTSLPTATRVQDLISRLTLEEKVSQMLHAAPAIPRLEIPPYDWWCECLHGVARAGIATVFPQAIGLAATWNTDLLHRVASAISDEARAKYHEASRRGYYARYFGLTYWSPNVNLFRDPRWGRGQETYGEDPYLTGRMGVAFVRGLQGDDPTYLKLVATPKHFAAHSGPEGERHTFDTLVAPRDLYETYLPHFKATVQEGGAMSVMSAYTRLNGEACTASPTLLSRILREEWGFTGYVVSDCGAIEDIYTNHKVIRIKEAAISYAVQAGCDLCCGEAYEGLVTAVREGYLEESAIDQALTRLFTARFRLGMFDPQELVPYAQIPYDVVACPAHRTLALQAARESIVLLKNDGVLPLRKDIPVIGVLGPDANVPDVLFANYNGNPTGAVTPLQGIVEKVFPTSNVIYHAGCELSGDTDFVFYEAREIIGQADVLIAVVGLSPALENEEGAGSPDRPTLDLPKPQQALLEMIQASGKPYVVVLLNGGALSVNWAQAHAPAIIEAWYPGEVGGTAIADVLFGDYNPAGRLPVTCYTSLDQLPPYGEYSPVGRTYRFFSGEPLYRFGHGLSYTTFTYSELTISATHLTAGEHLTVTVQVANTGEFAGDEVVQLYLSDVIASVPVPLRQLQGFQRLHLQPGATQTVTFTLTPEQMVAFTDAGQPFIEPGVFQLAVGGRQPGPAPARSSNVLEAEFVVG